MTQMDVMTVIKSAENGAVYDLIGHDVAWFHESHKLNHTMAIIWGDIHDFCKIMITYSNEQKFELIYSWQKLHQSFKFKFSGNYMTSSA